MKKKFIFFIIFLTFCLLVNSSFALNIEVNKTAIDAINFGDILEVKIAIHNLENREIPVSVKEHITSADPIEPQNFSTGKCPYTFCSEPPYYSWNVTLQPLSIYTITYKIKPLSFGDLVIPPTEVRTSSGETFYSDSLSVSVKCNQNGICEPDIGENYFTCREDCPSGSSDGICDLIKDGRCDPDCTPGADPDCLEVTTTSTTIEIIETTTTLPVPKPSTPIYIYLIAVGVIAVLVIFLISKIRVIK